jgi:cephalosporin hydroxylase
MSRKGDLVEHVGLEVDFRAGTVTLKEERGARTLPFTHPEAWEALAGLWLRAGWDAKYVYGFTWLGRPVIQSPDDLLTLQELVWQVRPDVIVEVGVAHGGSLVFYAGLLKLLGKRCVIGVDIEIRPHNRAAIEAHPLSGLIALVEGDSVASVTVDAVQALIRPGEKTMVVLDGRHSRDHVLAELRAYGPLVTPGSYVVAMDGVMARVAGAPRTSPAWIDDNPQAAVAAFLATDTRFELSAPQPAFSEGAPALRPTYCPNGFLRRTK